MKNDDMMTRARSSNPVSPTAFDDWTDTTGAREIVEAIIEDPPVHAPRTRERMPRRIAAGVVVLLALGIFGVQTARQSDPGTGPAWAASLVRIAEGSPRLLVAADGWNVTRADEFGSEMGEMTFSNGTYEMDLHWIPADNHRMAVEDRRRSADGSWKLTIAGREAVLFRYEGTSIYTALWRDEEHSLELRGEFPDVDGYRRVADTLEAVDIETWLSAMPESVIQPAMRDDTVDAMLADIPVHPSVDVGKLKKSERVSDRYQLGANVTGAVACAWIGQWVDATAAGDEERARAAVDAMATSHGWAVLDEMTREGAWPEVLWEYADAMAGDDPVSGGRPMTIEESYREALGCTVW